MASQRTKSIVALVLTLAFGILLGLLIPSIYHKNKTRNGQNRGSENQQDSVRDSLWLSKKIYRIIKPDSSQKEKIEPIALWAGAQLDSIESNAHVIAGLIIDSLKTQLHPIVTDEQWAQLRDFGRHPKGNRHGHKKSLDK